MVGSQRLILGKAIKTPRVKTSINRNHKMPLKIVSSEMASPTTPLRMKQFNPTGGESYNSMIRPISRNLIMMTPNQTKS